MLKKWLSGLLGTGHDSATPTSASDPIEYKGYLIVSEPEDLGGQMRVSGWIRKPGRDGEMQEHRFDRSDMVPGREACDQLMISKAQRYIDEVGDGMFGSR